MATKKSNLKKYTVLYRKSGDDGCTFLRVKAIHAFEAQRIAEKKFRKNNGLKAKDEIWLEYTFAGWVEVLNDTNWFSTSDKELKKL